MPNICFDKHNPKVINNFIAIRFYSVDMFTPLTLSANIKFEKGVILKFLRDIWPNTYRYKYGNTLII